MPKKQPFHEILLWAAIEIDKLRRDKRCELKNLNLVIRELKKIADGIEDEGVYYEPFIVGTYADFVKFFLKRPALVLRDISKAFRSEVEKLEKMGSESNEEEIKETLDFCLELSKQIQHNRSYRIGLVA